MYGYYSLDAYHNVSMRGSFKISIYSLLMVVYYTSAGVVPNRSRTKRGNFIMITMHVDAIFDFAWIHRYEAYIYIYPTSMRFDGHWRLMDTVMWGVQRRRSL